MAIIAADGHAGLARPEGTVMDLVERDATLRQLHDCLRKTAGGAGHVALISGEAGIGKTSLLRALASLETEVVLWWGGCDALQSPRPLAPLYDITRSNKTGFDDMLVAGGDRIALFEAVLASLVRGPQPILLVIEDAHWADAATLDLLKFLGRRIEGTSCLLAVSFRDDEVGATHPLRRLMPGRIVRPGGWSVSLRRAA